MCTGAFLLAKAGLLDGKETTTHCGSTHRLRQADPKATVHPDRRCKDKGKVVTTAGVSGEIDAALHVVGRPLGEPAARDTAMYMVHRWGPRRGQLPSPEVGSWPVP